MSAFQATLNAHAALGPRGRGTPRSTIRVRELGRQGTTGTGNGRSIASPSPQAITPRRTIGVGPRLRRTMSMREATRSVKSRGSGPQGSRAVQSTGAADMSGLNGAAAGGGGRLGWGLHNQHGQRGNTATALAEEVSVSAGGMPSPSDLGDAIEAYKSPPQYRRFNQLMMLSAHRQHPSPRTGTPTRSLSGYVAPHVGLPVR